ncbi:MAG: hypothetical protein Kow0031_21000 [Anaerolineae bacterium]
MRVIPLLFSLLVALVIAGGAAATAIGAAPPGDVPAMAAETPPQPRVLPNGDPFARPAAQGGFAIVNGIGIQDPNPTCGRPFTVYVNVANQSGQGSQPGTVSLQNTHRGTGNVNYTASQGYPNMPVDGNYVVPFQVQVNSYVSEGQQLTASTNGSTFSVKYDIRQGNCSKTSSSDVGHGGSPPSGNGQSLVVLQSGKCLDVPGGSRNSVTPVQQYSCTGNSNQAWSVESIGGGYYRIVSRFSGMCLDVQGFSQQPQALVQQFPCNGGDNQSFTFRGVGNGYSLVVAKHSGMCLDVTGASTADMALIQQYPCHGNANQQWIMR